ncbi:MAG: class II fructose-bisphosphate aldolase [bacterium]
MPLVTNRDEVIAIYNEAAEKGWVIPTFCSENLTTTEAILSASLEYGNKINRPNLPITIAITNLYSHRSQTVNYTHTRNWKIGLKLFLAELSVLTAADSPYSKLSVMVHLDHIQFDYDLELLSWDMSQFSSIMFDASALPFNENIAITANFVKKHKHEIVIEGACDEIIDAGGNEISSLTTPENAERYLAETAVDFMVANLGTEHRSGNANLIYHGGIARKIKDKVGYCIVLHGCSSVSNDQIRNLFSDGICKVNIWTTLERDSSAVLLEDMTKNAAKVAGADYAEKLLSIDILGKNADTVSKASLDYFTTSYRQNIIFKEMKKIVSAYLELWYV